MRERPDRAVVVVTGTSPNGFMRRIFEAGAEDVVVADEIGEPSLELRFAVEKAVARRQGTSAREIKHDAGELICVIGPKGGIGKTLTTANLAVALADAGHRVAAVDLDLQFGDLGLTLGLVPERTSYDLANSGGSLDADKVAAYMTEHPSGAHVLLAPIRPEQASHVTVEFLRDVYALLRSKLRVRDRRHAARVQPGGHRDGGRVHARVHDRDARRPVAQEHEAGPRDARAHGLRRRSHPPRPQPGRHQGRHLAGGRRRRSSAVRPTSSCRPIATSPAR